MRFRLLWSILSIGALLLLAGCFDKGLSGTYECFKAVDQDGKVLSPDAYAGISLTMARNDEKGGYDIHYTRPTGEGISATRPFNRRNTYIFKFTSTYIVADTILIEKAPDEEEGVLRLRDMKGEDKSYIYYYFRPS